MPRFHLRAESRLLDYLARDRDQRVRQIEAKRPRRIRVDQCFKSCRLSRVRARGRRPINAVKRSLDQT